MSRVSRTIIYKSMPSTVNQDYKRPFFYWSAHVETIVPALFRNVNGLMPATRERIDTSDGDFLDLDWRKQASDSLVVITHGLEGSSDRPYVLGMAKVFQDHSFDTLCWNFRSCSGEMNKTGIFYHSGATYDLEAVLARAAEYPNVYLVGFSLGGNLTLKYLGEDRKLPLNLKKAIVFSTPLDLASGSENLHTLRGRIYERRFLSSLRRKILDKAKVLPGSVDIKALKTVKTLRDFDDYYTAPLHGYKNAADYYTQCSSKHFLSGISRPTVICNALNDPFLTAESLDPELTRELPLVTLETTAHGGHVGFTAKRPSEYYWSELRALNFFLN